jgi:hypothetical protein
MVDKKKAYDRIYAYYIKKGYSPVDADHIAAKVADGQK